MLQEFLFFNRKEESIFNLMEQFQEIIDNNKADHFQKKGKDNLYL